ncbi:AGAP012141-PA-like protein [Anopheles sinensis]|uniref:AGAP012141-PA-like protein n=1 Tax=Anopheles sinensis TaxID=74873 RepID=A0A084WM25_ANOSI|nr:AGAP012141-PA-like protein [Anopheles sinensis]
MDRRPFLRNREPSELSPLTQSSPGSSGSGGHAAGAVGAGLTRNHSYGSILPYLGFLRNSLRRSASSSSQVYTDENAPLIFPISAPSLFTSPSVIPGVWPNNYHELCCVPYVHADGMPMVDKISPTSTECICKVTWGKSRHLLKTCIV